MARAGFIRRDRQHLRQLLAECQLEWSTLNCEVKRINRVCLLILKYAFACSSVVAFELDQFLSGKQLNAGDISLPSHFFSIKSRNICDGN